MEFSPNLDRVPRLKTNSVRGGAIEHVYMRNMMLFAVLTLTTIPGTLPAQGRSNHASPGPQETVIQTRPTGPATGPAGHWEGTFKINDREIGLVLDLAENAKLEWIASMSLPTENVTGLVATWPYARVVRGLRSNGRLGRGIASPE